MRPRRGALGDGHADDAALAVQRRRAGQARQRAVQPVGAADLGPGQHRLVRARRGRAPPGSRGPAGARSASPGRPCGKPGWKARWPVAQAAVGDSGRDRAPPSVISMATSPCGVESHDAAATPRPSATTMAAWRQPSTTWRAVSQTPASAMEKAVPEAGWSGPRRHVDHDGRDRTAWPGRAARPRPRRAPAAAAAARRRCSRRLRPANSRASDDRAVDQPVGKRGKHRPSSRRRRRRGSGRWRAWRRPAARRRRPRPPGCAGAGRVSRKSMMRKTSSCTTTVATPQMRDLDASRSRPTATPPAAWPGRSAPRRSDTAAAALPSRISAISL